MEMNLENLSKQDLLELLKKQSKAISKHENDLFKEKEKSTGLESKVTGLETKVDD